MTANKYLVFHSKKHFFKIVTPCVLQGWIQGSLRGLFSLRHWLSLRQDRQLFASGQVEIHRKCMETRHILALTKPLTVKLQSKAMDILKAKEELALLISVLTEMSNDIDATHHELYQDAVTIARQVDVQPDMPRVAQRQTHRPNAPASNPEDYYKINLTRVFLDHVLGQLDSRFKDDVFICYKEMCPLTKEYDTLYSLLSGEASWEDWPKTENKALWQRVYRKLKSNKFELREVLDPMTARKVQRIVHTGIGCIVAKKSELPKIVDKF
ncbi:predicted protein [Nematostella vectensis]|uniref:Uncharacterized protein n=1 Tax=Nematostella vectensis TaxID=45351 RepID=A7S1N1_NEMVE|nr:predicted protein [Nematostella vectensis]|eukprot:XP_001634453.1 predicted protein [Nematostella vectensis]